MSIQLGANDISLEELQELFKETDESANPQADEQNGENQNPEADNKEQTPSEDVKKARTKAVSDRINEVRKDEQNRIAKQMGYESYEALLKSKEEKVITDKGFDPKEVVPLVEELVGKRFENDPRMKDLERLRKMEVEEYAKKELADITTLTDGEITSLNQLPKDVVDAWVKTGSLKAAFLQIEGEKYIRKAKSGVKGVTDHLKNPAGSPPGTDKQRPLTAEEKAAWRLFKPTITEDELNKKTVPTS